MVFFSEGEGFQVKTADAPLRLMLIAGAPLKEAIAPYGPFVMNTHEEIQEALSDLRTGIFVWNEKDSRFKK